MRGFSVQWKKLQSQSAIIQKTGKNLKGMGTTVASVKSNLNYMGRYGNVIRALNSISDELQIEANSIQSMGDTLQGVSAVYKNTEQELLGKSSVISVVEKASDVQGIIEAFDWKFDKLLWKSVGKFGVVGTAVAAFGEMCTGGVSYKTLLGGGSKAVGIFGDLAKNAYSEKPDYRKVLFGNAEKGGAVKSLKDWADKNGTVITGKESMFSANIKKQLSEYSLKNCKNVGEKIKVGTKWAGVAFSGITNGISNYKEYQEKGITAERAVAETITETALDIGIGMVATAGATALLGASAPAVVVGVAAAGAVWAVDAATRFLTNKYAGEEKGFTEFVSDTVLDFGEKVNEVHTQVAKKVGNVFVNTGKSFAKWCTALA